MSVHFALVLDRERTRLRCVIDPGTLAQWRERVVEELMTPHSPYALAVHCTGEAPARAEFLDQWRELIAETVDRVHRARIGASSGPAPSDEERSRAVGRGDIDPQRTAVLILAAVHGGGALSRLARDPGPLEAALNLALTPLLAGTDTPSGRRKDHPAQ